MGSAAIISLVRDARVVELADSLDSGSSVHYARAGSSPASRTIKKSLKACAFKDFFFSSKVLTPILTLYVFVNHEWSRRDLAALSVFGGDEAIFTLSAPFFLQRLVYNDHTAFEGNAKQTARGRCY